MFALNGNSKSFMCLENDVRVSGTRMAVVRA